MKDNFDANAGSARKREDLPRENAEGKPNGAVNRGFGRWASNGHPPGSMLDFWTISEVLIRRWRWFVVGGLIFGAGFFVLASYKIRPKFTANAQLLRYESPVWKDFFQNSTPMSGETFAGLIRSPELLG